ncbi:MAG: pyridoxine 5'-phosphate synthase, partial [Cyclobacteriaceae bacterium]
LDLSEVVTTEFNIEGCPDERYLELVRRVKPQQATLVPDAPDAITSNAGWDTNKHSDFLKGIISELKAEGIRTSIFLDPDKAMIPSAAATGTDRIELYTEAYASLFPKDPEAAIAPYAETAAAAHDAGLEINAGHDLDLENLSYFVSNIPNLKEVSIGHALICDALYLGLENTIQLYLRACGHYR